MTNMRAATAILFLLKATAAMASLFDTLLPTTPPTVTRDPWRCTTELLMQYFDVPMPTGSLLTAILSYGDELLKDCTPTLTDALGLPVCPFPEQSLWCDFTTAAPSTLLPDYSSYGSVASSWWSKHSSAAIEFAEYCPNRWFKAMIETPAGAGWLNDTIAFAGCYAEAHPTTEASMTTTGPTATTGSGATTSGPKATTTTTTTTNEPNSVIGRAEGVEMWMLVGTGLAAAAANSVL